jgi:class 3 adenylate cyclase
LAHNPDWPRFRVELNTGPAIVGNAGSEDLRNFSAIGDTTNVAARLEGAAPAGGVLVGVRTYELPGPTHGCALWRRLASRGRQSRSAPTCSKQWADSNAAVVAGHGVKA